VAAACFKLWPATFLLLLLVPAGAQTRSPGRLMAALVLLAALVWAPTVLGPAARWDSFLGHVPAANSLGDANPSGLALAGALTEATGHAGPGAGRLATAAWLAYALALLAVSTPFLRRLWRVRDARHWVMAAVFLEVLLAPRPMAYGFLVLAPAPLFFAPEPFHRPAGRSLLALVLAAQGLARAANQQPASLLLTFAPFLLTLAVWLLILRSGARDATVAGPASALAPA
jgi:hypothetical protein